LPDAVLSPIRVLRLVRILRMLRLAQESEELISLALCVRRCLPALRLLLFFVSLQVRLIYPRNRQPQRSLDSPEGYRPLHTLSTRRVRVSPSPSMRSRELWSFHTL
jgi:hypothetical protein